MLTMNLGRGFFDAIEKGGVISCRFNQDIGGWWPGRYMWRGSREMLNPPISEIYDELYSAGCPPDRLIDELIDLYLSYRLFRVGHLKKLPLVFGFIGPRGSGKTCSAVHMISLDYLVRGLPVWSNVPITVRVVYKQAEKTFTTIPLDKLDMLDLGEGYRGGCVFIDEINMEAAEGSRYMSAANLQFSYALQQIRKRDLSVVWTCQGWNWVDNRTRWQTDYVIACSDAYLARQHPAECLGDYAVLRVHDLSGVSGTYDFEYEIAHKFITQFQVSKGTLFNRPYWQAYNTKLVQGEDNYVSEYKRSQLAVGQQKQLEAVAAREQPARTLAEKLAAGPPDAIYYLDDIWAQNNITDRSAQTKIGMVFSKMGFAKKRDSYGKYYYVKLAHEGDLTILSE